jgi:DNA-binding response OmpR family regulator
MAVNKARNLERTLKMWLERPADLILLALSQPGPIEQVQAVRAVAPVPLVVIVDSISEALYIDLLENGADLVVSRPFSARSLIALIRALRRRAGSVPMFSLPMLELSGLSLDPSTRTVEVRGKIPQRLTHLEFRLFYTLMIHGGQVLPTETIVERVWGYNGGGDRDLVRGLISRLRSKVEDDPRNPFYILTVPGVGYSFRSDPK